MPFPGRLCANRCKNFLVSPVPSPMKNLFLAPMCGITDHIFRALCYEHGCSLAFTEMISAMGYLCAPNQRATRELMKRGDGEPKLILQLFGRDPATVAEAAKRICDLGIYDGIDLNMGCPAKKIAPSGEGCGLMKTPGTAREMMRRTVAASSLPVSVKMRLGYDSGHINVMDYARMAEDEGISMITVHGRTREQQYAGAADWDMIARVCAAVHIPVIGNGDLFTAADALQRYRESGVDGVMIGRGAMGNPWIFREIQAMDAGEKADAVSLSERRSMILRHYRLMLEDRPEPVAVREMRKHIGWYLKGIRDAARVRADINRIPDAIHAMQRIDDYFDGLFRSTPEEEGRR